MLEIIKQEALSHPNERRGFDHINSSLLSNDERKAAITFLLDRIKEGDERVFEFTEKLLGGELNDTLECELSKLNREEHGYIYLSYFMYQASKDDLYIENIKEGIKYGDRHWTMRRSALGRILRGLLSARAYCKYCIELLYIETSPWVIKTALIGIDNYVHSHSKKSISPELETIRKLLTEETGSREIGKSMLKDFAEEYHLD